MTSPESAGPLGAPMGLDIDAVRAAFPYLETCCYLNTGATGLVAPGVADAARQVYDNLFTRGYDAQGEWQAIAGRASLRLAALLNVDAQDLDFAASSSDALNRIMQAAPISPGDRVVVAADEFPTMAAVFGQLAARGAEVVRVPVADEAARTDALVAAAEGARYLGVSHVHWSTGTRVDLERLSRACGETGARLIVDGVHAVGAVPVEAGLADAYVTSFFKWTLAGFGLGAGFVRADFRRELVPQQLGYANADGSHALRHSHLNYTGLAALDRALEYLSALGWEAVFGRVADLRMDLLARLRDAGFDALAPDRAAAGLVCVPMRDAEAAAARLDAQGIRVSPRGAALRVTPHFYNLPEENRRFCEALAELKDLR